MKTKYGLRGSLEPGYPFEELMEDLDINGMKVHVDNNTLEIGFDKEEDESKAREVVRQMVQLWSMAHAIKISINLNQKWLLKPSGGKDISIKQGDEVKIQVIRVTQKTISSKACIVNQELFDSSAFKNNLPLLKKSLINQPLQKALIYFYEEILDSKRPLYGVYKAIEELCFAVGGRRNLAVLAGQSLKYVDDLMQTTQTERHSRTPAKRLLTDRECRHRAKMLVEAYANSI